MKKSSLILLIITFSFCFSSYSQENKVKLTRPSKDFLNTRNLKEEITYSYLKTYYKVKGDKHFGKPNFKDTTWTCRWYQLFSNDIIYECDSCHIPINRKNNEVSWVVNVIFPNANKNDLIFLVELFYKFENFHWLNPEKTLFGNKDLGEGFYCEIITENNNLILRICSIC